MVDISEILKNFPQGTKLWSNVIGDCRLKDFSDDEDIIVTRVDGDVAFSKFGEYEDGSGLCNLFPSHEMLEWKKLTWKKGDMLSGFGYHCFFDEWADDNFCTFKSKFSNNKDSEGIEYTSSWFKDENEVVHNKYIREIENEYGGKLNLDTLEIEKEPEFKDGDMVFIRSHYDAVCIFKNKKNGCYYTHVSYFVKEELLNIGSPHCHEGHIKIIRIATDEEKQQLYDALAKQGKMWDAEKKQVVDLPKECEFKPFDKVLVRDDNTQKWEAGIFSRFEEEREYPYICVGEFWKICIPYNEQTKHLLGTTDNWKGGEE